MFQQIKGLSLLTKIKLSKTDALIIIDVQNDFLSGGSLPIPKGEEIIPILNIYISIFKRSHGKVFATRDWHPANHLGFLEFGGIWPPHCIHNTDGAKFHPNLKLPPNVIIISKATKPDKEAYSGFEGTNLLAKLQKEQIKRVFIGGLATEYCVKNTILDALKFGFISNFLSDASRGINSSEGDVQKAIDSMQNFGVKKIELLNFSF